MKGYGVVRYDICEGMATAVALLVIITGCRRLTFK